MCLGGIDFTICEVSVGEHRNTFKGMANGLTTGLAIVTLDLKDMRNTLTKLLLMILSMLWELQ